MECNTGAEQGLNLAGRPFGGAVQSKAKRGMADR